MIFGGCQVAMAGFWGCKTVGRMWSEGGCGSDYQAVFDRCSVGDHGSRQGFPGNTCPRSERLLEVRSYG